MRREQDEISIKGYVRADHSVLVERDWVDPLLIRRQKAFEERRGMRRIT